ncbi:PLASTID DIVISION PROTEIN PDV1 [Salix viminalis]|uniref:PLASTID DIVISION PROTEIN PDV1 n=1 Tax=Salix viminalis TaxID=40686 RepID=A0A9Q0NNB6_SALVM|nr:PLASTID DIVISION PROTEIN PDV1 [Salix viminalis]
MKWDMELEEIEAVLEKIWDLHDKLSDAIHSISRSHFLHSIKSLKTTTNNNNKKKLNNESDVGFEDNNRNSSNRASGFVFVKDFRVDGNDLSIQEAKSLDSIRTALENLEDQLEFFHTVQIHQQAERDAAIARLEQSRIILAMRLSEHHGKKYKVIEEALAFVRDVHDASHFVSPENLYGSPTSPLGENLIRREGKRPNTVIKVLLSSFEFAKKSLKLDHAGGLLGNAALFTVSMIAMLHLHQVTHKHHPYKQQDPFSNRNGKKAFGMEGSSSNGSLNHLDVIRVVVFADIFPGISGDVEKGASMIQCHFILQLRFGIVAELQILVE